MPIYGPTNDHSEIQRWADKHHFAPVEKLPSRVDGEPAELLLVRASEAATRQDVLVLSWADFFARFDQHGLGFVYDDNAAGYNEILQIEEKTPYRHQVLGSRAN